MPPRRIAVVDMGSNSLKFSITEVGDDRRQTVINERADTIRLSAGIAATGSIEPDRIARALESLRYYEQVARAFGVESQIGVATAALRLASNGQDLLDAVTRTTNWEIRVISGDEEAALTFRGLRSRLPERGPSCILDIGGGSSEVVFARDRELIAAESIHIGSGTLSDAWFSSDPPGLDQVERALERAIETLQASPVVHSAKGAALFLSGGNGMFLGKLATWQEVDIPFTPERFAELLATIATIESKRMASFLGIVPERARMLPAGGAIVRAMIEVAGPTSLEAVPTGIRGGLVAQLLDKESWPG